MRSNPVVELLDHNGNSDSKQNINFRNSKFGMPYTNENNAYLGSTTKGGSYTRITTANGRN